MSREVLYLAAHGFPDDSLPLGGGAAVCGQLLREWSQTNPFAIKLISPAILGSDAPSGNALVGFGERQYADFCRRFETASTAEVLRHDPFSGCLFVFRNRPATALKILVYDGQGFWLCQKRLSQGRFRWWPGATGTLEAHQLPVLLSGGDPAAAKGAEQQSAGETAHPAHAVHQAQPAGADVEPARGKHGQEGHVGHA